MNGVQMVLLKLGADVHSTAFVQSQLDPAEWTEPRVYASALAVLDFPVEHVFWQLAKLSSAVKAVVDRELRWLHPESFFNAACFVGDMLGADTLLSFLKATFPPAEVLQRLQEFVQCL